MGCFIHFWYIDLASLQLKMREISFWNILNSNFPIFAISSASETQSANSLKQSAGESLGEEKKSLKDFSVAGCGSWDRQFDTCFKKKMPKIYVLSQNILHKYLSHQLHIIEKLLSAFSLSTNWNVNQDVKLKPKQTSRSSEKLPPRSDILWSGTRKSWEGGHFQWKGHCDQIVREKGSFITLSSSGGKVSSRKAGMHSSSPSAA